jgi:competence ComEA-like helix-hairpin-helix protein
LKNRHTALLLVVTCIFAAFTLGFLAGRTGAPGDTVISELPQSTKAAVTAVTAPPPMEAPKVIPAIQPTAPGLINLNTATLAQLDSLPGIGPVLAQRIIDFRETHGPFTSLSQLTLVEGIGQKKLEAVLDLITIE